MKILSCLTNVNILSSTEYPTLKNEEPHLIFRFYRMFCELSVRRRVFQRLFVSAHNISHHNHYHLFNFFRYLSILKEPNEYNLQFQMKSKSIWALFFDIYRKLLIPPTRGNYETKEFLKGILLINLEVILD